MDFKKAKTEDIQKAIKEAREKMQSINRKAAGAAGKAVKEYKEAKKTVARALTELRARTNAEAKEV